MDDSDEALIRRCQAGDTEAFGVLVRRYAGRATGIATLLVGNYPDAMDVSQEAFVRAWRYIRTYRGESAFFTWYSTILRKVCLTWHGKRQKRKDTQPLDNVEVPGLAADPASLAEDNEQSELIRRAILQLSVKHREIIVLKHFEEFSYQQIATVLEIPVGTVMSRLHAARKALRNELRGNLP
jgi:RNA polymerase sigma-70 factor, ECF subfamily